MTLVLEKADDPAQLAARAVELLEQAGYACLATRGAFDLALAGGATPRATYQAWGGLSGLDWERVHLWYGDERCVPPDHADSNAGMAEAALLSELPVRPRVSRMRGEDPDPQNAARDYGRELKGHFEAGGMLDLVLLGLGTDGHTASLFPRRDALGERHHLCVATLAPDGRTARITLTVPALKRAGRLLFLVAGEAKAEMLRTVLEGPIDPEKYPAQFFLRDPALAVTLLADQAAAALLREPPGRPEDG